MKWVTVCDFRESHRTKPLTDQNGWAVFVRLKLASISEALVLKLFFMLELLWQAWEEAGKANRGPHLVATADSPSMPPSGAAKVS